MHEFSLGTIIAEACILLTLINPVSSGIFAEIGVHVILLALCLSSPLKLLYYRVLEEGSMASPWTGGPWAC